MPEAAIVPLIVALTLVTCVAIITVAIYRFHALEIRKQREESLLRYASEDVRREYSDDVLLRGLPR